MCQQLGSVRIKQSTEILFLSIVPCSPKPEGEQESKTKKSPPKVPSLNTLDLPAQSFQVFSNLFLLDHVWFCVFLQTALKYCSLKSKSSVHWK